MKRLRILSPAPRLAASLAITAPVSADLPVIDVSNLKQSILTAAHTLAGGQQPDHPDPAVRADAAKRGAQPALAAVLGIAADHQRHRPGEQPDEAGAEPRLRCRPDRPAVPAALPDLQRQRHSGASSSRMRGRAGRRVSTPSSTRWRSRATSSRIFRPTRPRSRRWSVRARARPALCRGSSRPISCWRLQSRQLGSTQALLSANARAQATEAMRRAEVEEAARAEWQRFWGSGVSYTPAPVQVFGGAPP